jgi:isocitrate lyase
MKAYVQLIQSKEAEIGCDVLTHQKVGLFFRSKSLLLHPTSLLSLFSARCLIYFTPVQWSGANYADSLLQTVTGGISSTSAMGAGVTEGQFGKH